MYTMFSHTCGTDYTCTYICSAQSADCVAQTEDPQNACQSADCANCWTTSIITTTKNHLHRLKTKKYVSTTPNKTDIVMLEFFFNLKGIIIHNW